MRDAQEVVDEAITATCTKPGKTEGKHCSVCNAVLVAQTEIPAKGHKWTAATCTGNGEKTRSCQREGCNETQTEEIAPLGHIPGEPTRENVVPATEKEDGSYDAFDVHMALQENPPREQLAR